MRKVFRNKDFVRKTLWGVAFIIILSFGFFGSASYLTRTSKVQNAGKVFGKTVSMEEYNKNYVQTYDQAKMTYGNNFSKIQSYLNLNSETWDRIILMKEAQKRRINVSDQEIIEKITQIPSFQRDGQFDKIVYKDILRYFLQRNPRNFEENVRSQIMMEKLFNQETALLTVPPDQLLSEFKKRNEKTQVSYVIFDASNYKSQITATDQEIKDYYNTHKEELIIPASTNIDYLFINLAADASDDDKKAAAKKTIDIYTDLTSNPDLDAVAKKNSLTVQTTGFINMQEPPMSLGWPFEAMQTVFSLEANKIAEPFLTNTGYVIAKIKETRSSYIPELNDVTAKVTELVKNEKAKKLAKEKADEFLPRLQQTWQAAGEKDFKKITESLGMTAAQTPFFKQEDYLPIIGLSKDFNDAALQLTPEKPLSPVVETAKGFCIIHFEGKEPFDEKIFNEQKETFMQTLLNEKRNEVLTSFMTRLRTQAKLQDDLPKNKE